MSVAKRLLFALSGSRHVDGSSDDDTFSQSEYPDKEGSRVEAVI